MEEYSLQNLKAREFHQELSVRKIHLKHFIVFALISQKLYAKHVAPIIFVLKTVKIIRLRIGTYFSTFNHKYKHYKDDRSTF